MPKFQSYHGCFGRNAGVASHAFNFHSPEWTQVRNRKCKDDKKISELSGSWKIIQDTKWVRNLAVAPETFAYLGTSAPFPGHCKWLCGAQPHSGNVRSAPRFKTPRLDLSLQEIEQLIAEVRENDKQLVEGTAEQAQTLSNLSKSLRCSKDLMERQKKIAAHSHKKGIPPHRPASANATLSSTPYSDITCFNCGRKGHKSHDCKKPQNTHKGKIFDN